MEHEINSTDDLLTGMWVECVNGNCYMVLHTTHYKSSSPPVTALVNEDTWLRLDCEYHKDFTARSGNVQHDIIKVLGYRNGGTGSNTYAGEGLEVLWEATPTPTREYLKKQEASGLKIGDIVYIFDSAEYGQYGWNNSWTKSMSDTVQQYGQIIDFEGAKGIRLEFKNGEQSLLYPYFVLEKVW